ncbi:MAG: alpha-ketoglutarate-dependent dioxygenase AlkB family protein [Flavobacteriaceae bacterium]
MIDLSIDTAKLHFWPDFLTENQADELLEELKTSNLWRQDKVKVFGKTYDQPRLCFLAADRKVNYTYSGLTLPAVDFSKSLSLIKTRIEQTSSTRFNSCLANLYRDGNDSNGWHSDDEKELGDEPLIASLSLGVTRNFDLKHKRNRLINKRIELTHGSLLLMSGRTQKDFKHQIAKSKRIHEPRINLTFRYIFEAL